jgi:thermitase
MMRRPGYSPVKKSFDVSPFRGGNPRAVSIGWFGLLLIAAIFFAANRPVQGQELAPGLTKKPALFLTGTTGAPNNAGSPATAGTPPTSTTPAGPAKPFGSGYILVQPRAGLSADEFDKALKPHGGKAVSELGNLGIYVVSLPTNASEQAVANALKIHPNIKFAEPDAFVQAAFVPNDTYYSSEWHQTMINAPAAWDYSQGAGVTVAILDSGIDPTHPDLASRLVPGWNFFDNNSNTADVYGHGTEVAGVVGAIGNNGVGVTGIAWKANLMPVRVTGTDGWAQISLLATGLQYAADHGARVANMSFAIQSYSTVITAAQYFKNKGGVVMNSAGNYAALDSSPASDALVSVSATDYYDNLAGFSSFGPYVDLSAPGTGIWTTTMGGGYAGASGTSFSSPLAAGVAAVMMGANSTLAPSQIVSILESTAVDHGTAGYDQYFGYGRVNAGAAVQAAAAAGGAADTQPPTVAITSPGAGSTVSGVVPVNVSASDNIGVTRVDLLINGAVFATDTTSPYAFSWDSTSLAGTTASVSARAYDAAGNNATATAISVTVPGAGPSPDVTPPTVAISSPSSGTSTVSGVVTVSVGASDNVGVTRVDLYVNGSLLASATSAPFDFTWDSTPLAGTNATLSAVAFDAAGNSASSAPVTVTVSAGSTPATPDTTPPTVTITSPANGAKVTGMTTINVAASDDVAVASVSLSIDGALVGTGNRSTASYKWNARKASAGTHTISATAKDTSGNQATVTISVTK